VTLAEFYALLDSLDRAYRPILARVAWGYGDLRYRGFTRAQARQRIESVRAFEIALRAMAVRDDFRSITD
jgi:hypothetical protein